MWYAQIVTQQPYGLWYAWESIRDDSIYTVTIMLMTYNDTHSVHMINIKSEI